MDSKQKYLIGIIIDASESMRQNWKNQEGKSTTTFEAVQTALNNQLWKISLLPSEKVLPADIFCLGMGFRKQLSFVDLTLQNGKEALGSDIKTVPISNLVCDLLALSQISPSYKDLLEIENALNDRWTHLADEFLLNIRGEIIQNSDQQLKIDFHSALVKSAYKKLHRNTQYRLYQWIKNTPFLMRWSVCKRILNKCARYRTYWIDKIENRCDVLSSNFVIDIKNRARSHFERYEDEYAQYIEMQLEEFATRQIQVSLELITAKHSVNNIIETLDENTLSQLAEKIYLYLNNVVRTRIQMPTIKEFNNYKNSAKNDIRASIKLRPFLPLIEQTVRKYGWELLEPFVESVVRELIYKKFNVQAKKMLPYWVTLATSMEANLPLKDITCIFPDKDSGKFIANNYMFGGTPIQEALSISSIRFNSSRYIDHQKLLIIISDGEFTSSNIDQNLQTPIAISTGLLKKTGVTILSLAICNKNILQKLQSHLPSDTPTGVQVLFDLASPCEENDFLFQCGLKTDNGKKWCFQVNHANHIETIMGKILGNYE